MEYALWWAVVVIVVGALTFRPASMELREGDKTPSPASPSPGGADDDAAEGLDDAGGGRRWTVREWLTNWLFDPTRRYNRVLYSIDLFVPAVSLYMEKTWRPKTDRRWARCWWVVQKCLGWVILPIGVVALTGIAKL